MTIAGCVCFLQLFAQQENGIENVNKLCGCFEVEFKYAETFSPDKNYKFHDREEINAGFELAIPIEAGNNKIVIQHLLVISDSVIVKHWREDWTFENPFIWKYKSDKLWIKEQLKPEEVKGKWTQTVWEVSDAPRYQSYSQFVNLDEKIIWQNTTDAPLPRREYSVRHDYNILRRTNRLNISESGYIHEQDNQKIIREGGADKLLAEEKGFNIYKRVAESKCAAAKLYWEKNKTYWAKVREVWEEYFSTRQSINLKTKVQDKPLHEYLNALLKEYTAGKISDAETEQKIAAEIEKFIEPEPDTTLTK